MTATTRDTIAAIATAPGRGGIGVVRVSGHAVPDIARQLLGLLPAPRYASLADFRNSSGEVLDQGLALYFPAPHSFTGEHVLELHGHGGPVVLDLLLARALQLGARAARAGEFSERAYLNGKLDLAQAEAVADLIDAGSAQAARAALQSLQGEFSRRVQAVLTALTNLRAYIEAALDFPEEEIDFLADTTLVAQADQLLQLLGQLRADSRQGQLLHDGMTVVLAGRPNAGKSSLLNRLTQTDTAIVSPVPGTTRDVLRAHIQIDGLPVEILDTAGLRTVSDAVEGEGVRRAQAAVRTADRVLLVIEDGREGEGEVHEILSTLPSGLAVTLVRNKIDITKRNAGYRERGDFALPEVALSAQTGIGLETLRTHLKDCMGYQHAGQGSFSARRRHLDALARTSELVDHARAELLARNGELSAEQLRLAQEVLGEITGTVTSDDLLGRIFSEFCIGK